AECRLILFLYASAPTVIYTLSLHDALPIWRHCEVDLSGSDIDMSQIRGQLRQQFLHVSALLVPGNEPMNAKAVPQVMKPRLVARSEEHTSELQSRGHLVCRLLLEKKKKNYK